MEIFARVLGVILLISPHSKGALSPRTVQTKYGTLRGTVHEMRDTKMQPVEMFLGVPYAAPPIGALRFMPPVTPRGWKKVFLADRLRPACPQKFPDISNRKEALKNMPLGRFKYLKRLLPFIKQQSEDCLHLNIYIPAAVSESNLKLPVMVYIHGESYEWGTGNPYDGRILSALGNIVIITLNFRLGILGFLTTLDDTARGNYGIMDQIAALHWIQENIESFGGDSTMVTIMGHGTGAVFADLLISSPLAKGLFHRVILLSGSSLTPRAIVRYPLQYTASFLQSVNCQRHTISSHIMKCLRSKSLKSLMEAEIYVEPYQRPFGPVIDGVIIPEDPQHAMYKRNMDQGNPSPFHVIIGMSKVENYFDFSMDEVRFGLDEARRNSTVENFIKVLLADYRSQITAVVLNEYTDWTKSFQHPISYLDSTIEILGDADTIAPIIQTSNLYSRRYPKTYTFVFTHQTEHGDYSDRLGTIHGEELPYIFGAPLDPASIAHFVNNFTQNERMLSKSIMAYFINFIRRGDPNDFLEGDHRTRFNRFEWPTYEHTGMKTMALGMKPREKDHYRAHKLSTWLNLIPKLIGIPAVDWFIKTTPAPSTTILPKSTASFAATSSFNVSINGGKDTLQESIGNDERFNSGGGANATFVNLDKGNSDRTHVYSTALSVTIAVGCSLLILNIFAFVALYYKKQKTDEAKQSIADYKKQAESTSQNSFADKQVIVAPSELQAMFKLEKPTMNCDVLENTGKHSHDILMNCGRRETKIETAFDKEIYETNYTTFVRPNEINV